MNQLQKALLITFYYHDIFNYPLKESEILKFLIQLSQSKTDRSLVEKALKQLISKKKINYKNPYYFLSKKEKTVNLRKNREKHSRKKSQIAKITVKILSFVPWIKMIAITGALAMKNSDKDDDIDFLIITTENRLWMTRFLLALILEILGKRRRPNDKKFKDKICLNMFLDETALSLSKGKRNLFTAHEICQMRPIFNRNHTYEKFIKENLWVKDYLPNGIVNSPRARLAARQVKAGQKSKLFDFLENLTYKFQTNYMRSKKTNEQIFPNYAFFHPQGNGQKILQKYKESLQKLNLKQK